MYGVRVDHQPSCEAERHPKSCMMSDEASSEDSGMANQTGVRVVSFKLWL